MQTSKYGFIQVDVRKPIFVHLKIFKQGSSSKLIECETLGLHKYKVNEGLGILNSKRKEDTSFSGNSKSNEKKVICALDNLSFGFKRSQSYICMQGHTALTWFQ